MKSSNEIASPRGWHSRGYLPHFDAGDEYTQFVTFRLADALPHNLVASWKQELLAQNDTERKRELSRRVERHLDLGLGACHLGNESVAVVVENALMFFDSTRYAIHSWVVMPNHVHALFTPLKGFGLSEIVGSWKSFTSKNANKRLGRTGHFWQEDYFDRYILDEQRFYEVVNYIEQNPVTAGLCMKPEDWRFGSARRRMAWSAGVPPASVATTSIESPATPSPCGRDGRAPDEGTP